MKIEKILLIVGSVLTVFFSSCGSSSPLDESKIILEDGIIQSLDKDNNLKIVRFDRTLLNFSNYDNFRKL